MHSSTPQRPAAVTESASPANEVFGCDQPEKRAVWLVDASFTVAIAGTLEPMQASR